MSLLSLPISTIFATSTVCSSETRRPCTNSHLEAEPLHVLGDLRAAAVDDHGVHADVLEQHDVGRERLAQRLLGHRRAAVLDHDRLARRTPGCREATRAASRSAGCRAQRSCHVEYSELNAHVLGPEVAEEHLGLLVAAGAARAASPPRRAHRLLERAAAPPSSSGTAAPPRATCDALDRRGPARAGRRPAAPGRRPAASGPSSGRAPCRAHFTSGELATARATGSTRARRRRAPRAARLASAPSPSATHLDRELAQQRVQRRAEGRARPRCRARHVTPDAPPASTNTESLVDSWPSTVIRSKERSTAGAAAAARASRDRPRASVSTKHSIVAKHGEIMPGPLCLGAEPHRARPAATPPGRRAWASGRWS